MSYWTLRKLARAARARYTDVRRWYITTRHRILNSVSVQEGIEDGVLCTTVRVRQAIPFGSRRARYLITTTPQRVTARDFGSDAEEINQAAGSGSDTGSGQNRRPGKGRVLFFVDRAEADRPLCALAFHIPSEPGEPPLIRRLAGNRTDSGEMHERSIAALLVLKAYAHAVSWKSSRGGPLDAIPESLDERRLLERLGFRREPSTAEIYRQEPYEEFGPRLAR